MQETFVVFLYLLSTVYLVFHVVSAHESCTSTCLVVDSVHVAW